MTTHHLLLLLFLPALLVQSAPTLSRGTNDDAGVQLVAKEPSVETPHEWAQASRASGEEAVRLHIAVKQQNLRQLEETLLDVSHPRSPRYGQHLSFEQVHKLVAPKPESVMAVKDWLASHGVDLSSVYGTPNNDFLQVDVSVALAEELLNTKYYEFTLHRQRAVTILRTPGGYSLPANVAAHVDFVGPTVRFPNTFEPIIGTRHANEHGVNSLFNTPDVLRQLYNVGDTLSQSANNSVAVTGFLEQYIDPNDLTTFFTKYFPPNVGQTANIVGPNVPSEPGIEASLDIQYVMSMGAHANATFWYTPGRQPGNPENEPFLQWLFDVGNATFAPLVFSISYGDNENSVNYDYAVRVNAEFQKAGVRGISILASSGDGGVSGGQPGFCSKFIPTFPAASPWITAVGGTASSSPEVGAGLSSGGFSDYWSPGSWQTNAISQYFNVAKNLPPSADYNRSGAGFPDVSAQCENFIIMIGGFTLTVAGTSCSSPTFAGIVSLLNDIRLQEGKSSLGFLNPLFYENPSAFNDILSGNNPGCSTNGFYAAPGWDPITGLGTPDFQKLAEVVKNLP